MCPNFTWPSARSKLKIAQNSEGNSTAIEISMIEEAIVEQRTFRHVCI